MKDSLLCYQHNPEVADERHRSHVQGGRTGGRGRPKGGKELVAVEDQLQSIADRTLTGELDTKRATAATQALQALIRAVEVERRVEELYEVEQALEELEAQARRSGSRGVGQYN